PSYSIKAVAPALAAWDPPGHGHAWLAIPTIAACHDRLRAEGHGARAAKAAVDDLRAAATDLDLADEAELLAPSAAMSIVWHDRWRQTESPVWRQLIGWYNQDDLRASDAVFRWLAAIAQDNPGIDAAGTPPRRSGSARRTTR
ncbi:MAG: hypothetical protein RLZZ127_2809, partial [Planctomycetota bacterium]